MQHASLKMYFTEECAKLMQKKESKLYSLIDIHRNTITKEDSWIPELKLTTIHKSDIESNAEICDAVINAATSLLQKHVPHMTLQHTTFHQHLQYCPFESVHIHHNGAGHFVTSSSIGNKVTLYDSLNLVPNSEINHQLVALCSVDEAIPTTYLVKIPSLQHGSTNCGIFAIAYATELTYGTNPATVIFDQAQMRPHLINCLQNRNLIPFPKK